jgi:hypothetical protein
VSNSESNSANSSKNSSENGSRSSTERELREAENLAVPEDNPYTMKTPKELKHHDISAIKKQGSQWDNHIENLDDSNSSVIFGEAIEKSSLDHFQGFDNSVATHQEFQKQDNFFFDSE